MRFRSNLAKAADAQTIALAPPDRPRPYRYKFRTLAYVGLDSTNGGILRDLSESGMATQALVPLRPDQQVRLQLDLPHPRTRIETQGRVAWTDSLGQAGLQFVNLPERSERSLKEWLLTQLLADAHRAGAADTGELLFSNTPRQAIRLVPQVQSPRSPVHNDQARELRLLWFRVPAQRFSQSVDALVVLCAVLLFGVMALLLTDTLPPGWIASLVMLGAAAIFFLLYWGTFKLWFGATPGHRLAELAGRELAESKGSDREDRVRFR